MADIQPLNDRVLIETQKQSETTKDGLFMPTADKDAPREGRVVAVGPGRLLPDGTRVTPSVSVGDRVVFGKYAGDTIILNSKTYLILRDEDIFATIGGSQ